jgi:hypothetical protein
MGDIKIKITDITIPNDFNIFYKAGITPYPFDSGYTEYNGITYSGGTTTIDLIGDFNYDEEYWIMGKEVDYPERWMVKNILINDGIIYQAFLPTPSPTPTITLTPTITQSITITPSITPSVTPTLTVTLTPTLTPSPSPVGNFILDPQYGFNFQNVTGGGIPTFSYPITAGNTTLAYTGTISTQTLTIVVGGATTGSYSIGIYINGTRYSCQNIGASGTFYQSMPTINVPDVIAIRIDNGSC